MADTSLGARPEARRIRWLSLDSFATINRRTPCPVILAKLELTFDTFGITKCAGQFRFDPVNPKVRRILQ